MNKAYILTFSITILVMICSVLLGLVILLPQQSTNINVSLADYNKISEASYKFEQTKDISIDNLVHEYSVSDAQMNTYKKNYQYVTGNSDPFSATTSNTENNGNSTNANTNTSNSTNNNTNNNNNNSGSNTNSNGNTVVVGK